MLDLGIVILNWNTRDLLQRCLETVFASEGDFSYQVVVVDNHSPDDSAAMVARDFPQAQLIVSEVNNGYSYGNNLGLRALGYRDGGQPSAPDAPRYALLLNPDTEVPPARVFAQMVAFMDAPGCRRGGRQAGAAGWHAGQSVPPQLPDAAGLAYPFFRLGQAVS